MALQTGRSDPSSSVVTMLHGDPVEDALELALGEDAALDELVRITVRPPFHDPARHARRDAGQLLDAAERGGVQVDRGGTLRLGVPAMQEAASGKRDRCDENHREDARRRHEPARLAGRATSVEQSTEPVPDPAPGRSERTAAAADGAPDVVAERGPHGPMERARNVRLGPREKRLVPPARTFR